MLFVSFHVISICFCQWWKWRKDPPHCPHQPPSKGSSPAAKTRFVSLTGSTYRQWQTHQPSSSLLSFRRRSLVQQQPPVQVPRPGPPYPDLTSAGLAHQPDEATHPLPFTSHTEWVDHEQSSPAAVDPCSLFSSKCPLVSLHSAQRGAQDEAGEETSQSGVTRLTAANNILSLRTQSSVPNPFSPQLCTHPVPSRWKTRGYKYRHFVSVLCPHA